MNGATKEVSLFDKFEQAIREKEFFKGAMFASGSFGAKVADYVRKAMQAALDAAAAPETDPVAGLGYLEQARQIAIEFGATIPDDMVTKRATLELDLERRRRGRKG